MIIVRIKGGLGNQLFQYAAAYSLARSRNDQIGADISYFNQEDLRKYRLNCLKLSGVNIIEADNLPLGIEIVKNKYINRILRCKQDKIININKTTSYVLEKKYSVLIDNISSINTQNIYLDGYFQTPLYFQKYRNDLFRMITPVYNYSNDTNKLFREIYAANSVAVHVRRGDFLHNNRSQYHYVLGLDYYINAITYIKQRIDNPIFYFFSDDIEWVKENWGDNGNIRFILSEEDNSDITELMLMKACKHIITANSSFSWWAAWLKDNEESICIVPEKQYGNPNMIPVGWIKI